MREPMVINEARDFQSSLCVSDEQIAKRIVRAKQIKQSIGDMGFKPCGGNVHIHFWSPVLGYVCEMQRQRLPCTDQESSEDRHG